MKILEIEGNRPLIGTVGIGGAKNSAVALITAAILSDNKTTLTNIMKESKTLNTFKFIVIDTIDNIKTISYEDWYKGVFDLSEGVWMGNGKFCTTFVNINRIFSGTGIKGS